MKSKNSINYIFYYLFGAVFLIILFSNYISGDSYWTPLRSIYIFKTTNNWDWNNLKNFVISTSHNDSIKLFPVLIEILGLKVIGKWEPRISLLIGLISWSTAFFLYLKLIFRNFALTSIYKKAITLLLFLSFFGPPYFFYRFTILFAIFKTLPSLCLLSCTLILFPKKPIFKIKEIIFISILCIVGQYSYSWGSILWITNLIVLIIHHKNSRRKDISYKSLSIFCLLGTISSTIYISILNYSTILNKFELKNIYFSSKSLFSLIKDFYTFLSTYSLSYLGSLDSYSRKMDICLFDTDISNNSVCTLNNIYLKIIIITFTIMVIFLFIQAFNILKNKILLKTIIHESGPFLFIAINSASLIIGNLFLRTQVLTPPRYFNESTLFSISLLIISLITIKHSNFKFFKLFLLFIISLSAILNFLNINHNIFRLMLNDPIGDNLFVNSISCIRNASQKNQTFDYLYNKCEFSKINKYFHKNTYPKHPFIKITDHDEYTKKVFEVIGN